MAIFPGTNKRNLDRPAMYAQCPQCHTLFRVRAEQLKAAHGHVRCSRCLSTFNAVEVLLDEPTASQDVSVAHNSPPENPATADLGKPTPPNNVDETTVQPPPEHLVLEADPPRTSGDEAFKSLQSDESANATPPPFGDPDRSAWPSEIEGTVAPPAVGEPLPAEDIESPRPEPEPEPEPGPPAPEARHTCPSPTTEASSQSSEDTGLSSAEQAPAPRFGEPADRSRVPMLWGLGVSALLAALVVQAGYFKREALSHYPEARPLLESLCGVAGCELPPRRAPAEIRVEHREVRVHPSVPQALLISLRIVNLAPFDQPYPVLELMLLNTDGKVVARRRFRPAEYLPAEPEYPQLMPTGVPIHLRMELVDPGEETTGFEFRFH